MTALAGMRVLDLTQWESGPSCTQQLAWLGADVVKVEPTGTGDGSRGPARATAADSIFFLMQNNNKQSVAIDLRMPAGLDLLLRLAERFDVFVENFAFGVAEKLGIGYDAVHARNPRMVYGSIKGFGLSGPYRAFKSFDPIGQAAGGAFSVTGDPDGPPMRPGYTVADHASGMYAAIGILAAYVEQQRTGVGQQVEVSMQEAIISLMRTTLSGTPDYDTKPQPRRGNRMTPPTDLYRCAGGGPNDYLQITVATEALWATLARAIGRAELLTDERFCTRDARLANGDALHTEIEQWTVSRTKWEAMQQLGEAGVPAAAVYDTSDIFHDAHLAARGAIATVQHPQRGAVKVPGSPVRLSNSSVGLDAAPLLGQHTRAVLAAELGLDDAAIDQLRDHNVIETGETS